MNIRGVQGLFRGAGVIDALYEHPSTLVKEGCINAITVLQISLGRGKELGVIDHAGV